MKISIIIDPGPSYTRERKQRISTRISIMNSNKRLQSAVSPAHLVTYTAVKRAARAQFPPKLTLKVKSVTEKLSI